MKRNIGIVIFTVVIVLAIVVSCVTINLNESDDINKVTIIEYDDMFGDIIKTIEVTDKSDIDDMRKIYNKLRKQKSDTLDLALAKDIEIILNDEIIIRLQLSNSDYCTYTGLGSSEYVDTPEELVQWVNKILNK